MDLNAKRVEIKVFVYHLRKRRRMFTDVFAKAAQGAGDARGVASLALRHETL